MAITFREEELTPSNLNPTKFKEEFEAEVNGKHKNSGEIFTFRKQPTEIFPDEEAPVDTGLYHGPLTKRRTQIKIFNESPEGQAMYKDISSILPSREESLEIHNKALSFGSGGETRMSKDRKDRLNREMGVESSQNGGSEYYDIRKSKWKKKIDNIRSFLRNKSIEVGAPKSLKSVADYYLKGEGLTVSQAIDILSKAYSEGLFPLADAQSFENELEIPKGVITGENKAEQKVEKKNSTPVEAPVDAETAKVDESVNEPEVLERAEPVSEVKTEQDVVADPYLKKVKISRIIDIPKQKMRAEIPAGEIKIENKYNPTAEAVVSGMRGEPFKESEILKKSRVELPEKEKDFFESEAAIKSYREGNIEEAESHIDKISDLKIQAETAGQITEEAVNAGNFDNAVKFVVRIKYENYSKQLMDWVKKMKSQYSKPAKEKSSKISESSDVENENIENDLILNDRSVVEVPMDLDLNPKPDTAETSFSSAPAEENPKNERVSVVNEPKEKEVNNEVDSEVIPADFDSEMRDLREQIKVAERFNNEPRVLDLENKLRVIEQQKIQSSKIPENKESVLNEKIKEQIARVKAVENTNEKAYTEELAKLRVLERQRDSERAPKTEPKVESPVLGNESKKDLDAEVDRTREGYAKTFIDWETKSRFGKRMFIKTLQSLGVIKPTPARLSEMTPAMKEAKEEYLEAMRKRGINLEIDAKKLLLSERFNLEEKLLELRLEKSNEGDKEAKRDAGIMSKAVKGWKNKDTKQKVVASAVILGGLGVVAGGVEQGKEYFEGLRVDRNMTIPSSPSESLPEIESAQEIKIPEGFEIAPKKVFVKNEIRTEKPEENQIKIEKKEVVSDIDAKTEGKEVTEPTEIKKDEIKQEEVLPASRDVKPVPALETNKTIAGFEQAMHIPYGNSFVDIVELDNGARAVKFDGMEIAHEHDSESGKYFYLDDQYQDGPMFKNIRGAFATYLSEVIVDDQKMLPHIEFEGGRIDVLKDPSLEGGVSVLLNGRLVATGAISGKKVKISTLKDLKGPWFAADTVYERAKNFAEKSIKSSLKK